MCSEHSAPIRIILDASTNDCRIPAKVRDKVMRQREDVDGAIIKWGLVAIAASVIVMAILVWLLL